MLTPEEMVEGYQSQASLVARCIIYGLVEPTLDITPNLQVAVAEELSQTLGTTPKAEKYRLPNRLERAFQWAVRDDVQPELAILMGETTLATIPKMIAKQFRKTEAYIVYKNKLGELLNG